MNNQKTYKAKSIHHIQITGQKSKINTDFTYLLKLKVLLEIQKRKYSSNFAKIDYIFL